MTEAHDGTGDEHAAPSPPPAAPVRPPPPLPDADFDPRSRTPSPSYTGAPPGPSFWTDAARSRQETQPIPGPAPDLREPRLRRLLRRLRPGRTDQA